MHTTLWIITGLLAAVFCASGAAKLLQPKDKLVASSTGAALAGFSPGAIKVIGLLEVLAAFGLLLPGLVGVATSLVPVAAIALVLLMVGAALTHARRHEAQPIIVNAALLASAAVVAYSRLGPYPVAA
ncbi:DoxX family protein [Nocardioides marmotae]|uniref:DoxX family protein n=1 Tax=Nocardioides marmotae TaxID=2663857 RepID=UPI0012B651C4|nr:DoxX family protein [Nocardioides marmotae]MBC9735259.1 DoxX family protein [Nocardioides marmotae]MTB86359.1 DoxX family protein [Nocardioides marmotae]